MYAVAPIPIGLTFTETYAVATPNTWQPVRIEQGEPVIYAGFEVEGEFTSEQIAEIESMGGTIFETANQYITWLHS
jgi:hypothetical protein